MAKVGHIRLRINTEHAQQYDLFYTQAKGFEVRGVPTEFLTQMGVRSYNYATEHQLKETLEKSAYEYRKLMLKQKLVIVYSCSASTDLRMNKVSNGHYQGLRQGVSRKIGDFTAFTAPKCSIGIDFDVLMEFDDGKKTYKRVNDELKVSSSSEVHVNGKAVIDYTEERWAVFMSIKKSMEQMVVNLSQFFDLEAEEAVKLIDNGMGSKLLG